MKDSVLLRYLGTSGVFEDPASGNVWTAGGDALEVSAEDAERLMALPVEMWERVQPDVKAEEDAEKERKAEADRRLAARVAAAKKPAAKAKATDTAEEAQKE